MSPESEREPELKVVDRRWWAKQQSDAAPTETWTPGKPTHVEHLERQLAEKDRELQDTIAKYREATREFEESRIRQRKDIARDIERGRRLLLVDFLDVLDNLDRAVDAATRAQGDPTLVAGVDMVRRQFLTKLEGFGVSRLEALNQPFDPAQHEAVAMVPTTDASQDGVVCSVLTPGYTIQGDVLRHATVAVAKFAREEHD